MIDINLAKTWDSTNGRFNLDICTRIEKGSFIALFGASGAGKTTILRMLAGLTNPDAGQIVVDGETWFDAEKRINLPPRKRSIGFVFQDYALFPNLSVRANIAYATNGTDSRWVNELLELTGLSALQERLPTTLSGGQKQRVALARAIARKPALLLLDEPLSALDLELRLQLQGKLAALHKRFGLTTLLVSHELGEVFRLSQHVLRLEAGRIVQSGSPTDVFLQPKLSGKLNLHAQILAVRREEVVYVVSLLVGQDIIEVIVSDNEADGLREGDLISVSAKAISPFLLKRKVSLDIY